MYIHVHAHTHEHTYTYTCTCSNTLYSTVQYDTLTVVHIAVQLLVTDTKSWLDIMGESKLKVFFGHLESLRLFEAHGHLLSCLNT